MYLVVVYLLEGDIYKYRISVEQCKKRHYLFVFKKYGICSHPFLKLSERVMLVFKISMDVTSIVCDYNSIIPQNWVYIPKICDA